MTGDIVLMATTMPNSKVSSMLTRSVSRNVKGLVFDDVVADIVLLVEDLQRKTSNCKQYPESPGPNKETSFSSTQLGYLQLRNRHDPQVLGSSMGVCSDIERIGTQF